MHASRQRGRTRRVRLAVLCACGLGAVLPLNAQGAPSPGLSVPPSPQLVAAADPGDGSIPVLDTSNRMRVDESWGV